MTELEQKIQQEKTKFTEAYSKRTLHWMDENFVMRDQFASELTHKFSNTIITINVGIIGATSFLITNFENLSSASKILALSLILPLISIIIELHFKRKVLDINREACDRRGKFLQKLIKEKILPCISEKQNTFEELESVILKINDITNEGFKEIMDWVKRNEPRPMLLRKISLTLLISTLLSIILIMLIESGSLSFILYLKIIMSAQWFNTIGLSLNILGAIILSCGLVINKKKAIELGASKWVSEINEENLKLPQVKDRLRQSKHAIIGLAFLFMGFTLQIITNWIA